VAVAMLLMAACAAGTGAQVVRSSGLRRTDRICDFNRRATRASRGDVKPVARREPEPTHRRQRPLFAGSAHMVLTGRHGSAANGAGSTASRSGRNRDKGSRELVRA
jgi:hypothetical protein